MQVKTRNGTMCRADVLLGALKDLMNTLFSHPDDPNLICAVKLLKVYNIPHFLVKPHMFVMDDIDSGDQDLHTKRMDVVFC